MGNTCGFRWQQKRAFVFPLRVLHGFLGSGEAGVRVVRGASGPVVGPQLRTHVALVLQDLAVAAVSPEAADVIIVQDLHLQTSADVRICTELGDWGGLPEETPAFTHGIGDAQNTAFCSRSPAPRSDPERELVFIV